MGEEGRAKQQKAASGKFPQKATSIPVFCSFNRVPEEVCRSPYVDVRGQRHVIDWTHFVRETHHLNCARSQQTRILGQRQDMSEQRWDSEIRGATVEIERYFGQVVGYVNDRIVPAVRSEAKVAARDMAAGLRRLADALEPRRSPGHGQAVGKER
jgi:hypothetical protein